MSGILTVGVAGCEDDRETEQSVTLKFQIYFLKNTKSHKITNQLGSPPRISCF